MLCPVCDASATRFFMRVGARDYWRCVTCESTFLEPAQCPGAETELAQYRLHCNEPGDAAYRQYLGRLATPLLERLPPAQCGLDYGCGPGPALAAMLREAGHTVALYDPYFHNDPLVLGKTYRFITCTETAEHFHSPAREFGQLARLLEPGGLLAVMTTFQTDDARFSNWHYRRDPTHVVFYRAATFHHLARIHGWTCEIPCANVVFLHKHPTRDC